jgi:hypothetical protein
MIALPTEEESAGKKLDDVAMNSARRREAQDPTFKPRDWLVLLEWLAVTLVALCAIALHVHSITSVGGLWRDETNSVNLATLPSFGQIWSLLEYDSFPIVFVTVLRGWTELFGAENDAALRALGLLIGLGVLGVLCRNARFLGARVPVLSLALIGLNPMVIRYGDSVRGYGLGILLILLTFGAFWRLVNLPSPPPLRRILAATVLALLSVHCLFYNSVLLFAIAAGALAVTVRARAWRTAAIVLGIGTISGSSLLVYVPMMTRKQDWTFMVSYPADFAWLWKRTCEVIGSPDPLGIWLWLGLVIVGLGLVFSFAALQLWRRFARRLITEEEAEPVPSFSAPLNRDQPRALPDAVLFATVALIVGVIGYAAFLRTLHYYTQPWYYITLVAFAALALDVVFGAWPITARPQVLPLLLRSGRLAVALALLCFTGASAWKEVLVRHTNLDLLATRLQPLATTGNVILVPRWECAITLSRYYRGPAEIVTIPPIDDHRFHRYDLVLRQMMTVDPLRALLARLEEVLRSGHRVFLVGNLPFPDASDPLPSLPPAYRDAGGNWHVDDYHGLWRLQVGQFLRAHATRTENIKVSIRDKAHVQEFESLGLGVVEGWR